MTLREIITKWGFQVEHAPLDKLEHHLEGINKKIEGVQERLEFLAAAEVVKGIYELAERFAHFAEETHAAAESAGITVEAFQKLSFAAGQSAVSGEEMSSAMAKLSKNLYDARKGGAEAAKVFSQAGFTAGQVQSFRTGSDVMLALADRFKNIQDPIKKQAIAMELMGRGSVNMVGFLSKGSAAIKGMGDEAEKLGVVLSGEQIEALVEVEHGFQKLAGVVRGFAGSLAAYLAPSITDAINDFLKFYEVNKELINSSLQNWAYDVAFALGFIWQAVKLVAQGFFDFAKSHEVLVRRVTELLVGLGALVAALFVAQKTFSLVSGAVGLLSGALETIGAVSTAAFTPLIAIAGVAQSAIVALGLKLATLAEVAFPALSEAILGFSAFLEATPVGWFATAVAGLVVVLHDAWKLLTGGSFSDTWIGQAIGGIKSLGGSALSFLGLGGSAPATAGTLGATASPFASASDMFDNIQAASSLREQPFSIPSASSSGGEARVGDFRIDAPITIQTPAGTDNRQVAAAAREGVKDHLDRVHRESMRSLRGAVAY